MAITTSGGRPSSRGSWALCSRAFSGLWEPIRRDYPIEELRADLDGLGVIKSVYVQTNWAPEAYEDEAAWVQRTADRTGWPHAIGAYADMSADDVRPQLDR